MLCIWSNVKHDTISTGQLYSVNTKRQTDPLTQFWIPSTICTIKRIREWWKKILLHSIYRVKEIYVFHNENTLTFYLYTPQKRGFCVKEKNWHRKERTKLLWNCVSVSSCVRKVRCANCCMESRAVELC